MAIGSHVFFADGKYDPQTADGLELLHHELTHVVQHERNPVLDLAAPRLMSHPGDASEREATRAADQLGSDAANVSVGASLAAAISCDPDDTWYPPMAPPVDQPGPTSSTDAPTSFPGDTDVPAPAPAASAPVSAPPAEGWHPPMVAPADQPGPSPAVGPTSSPDAPTSFPGDINAPVPGATAPTPEQCANWNAGLPDEWRDLCPGPDQAEVPEEGSGAEAAGDVAKMVGLHMVGHMLGGPGEAVSLGVDLATGGNDTGPGHYVFNAQCDDDGWMGPDETDMYAAQHDADDHNAQNPGHHATPGAYDNRSDPLMAKRAQQGP